jgi:Flp pilus assembly protein TadG
MAEVEITAGKRRRNRFGAFIKDSKGATAVEFALIATPFLALIAALIQTFLLFFAQSLLENAVLHSARQILTGQVQTADASMTQAAALAAFHCTV